ncbi:DUF6268 family outer membrane beta-barrel protein [Winogradskyella maritima]|uniref:DUF6268 family outer membrane beta-barrel protein n=1 Tax=Winogradskyella maritima TaxID=1517766 RepID=A0ABV8AJZ2_9FLAO|nr:DUF6268 family outer membrane beta-barrel protein [Winogradskyella maritima]
MRQNIKIIGVVAFVFMFCFQTEAQLTDLARLEYSFIPKRKSEDQYTRLRALINYPIEIKNDSYLIIGGEYNHIILNFDDKYNFETAPLETLHIIDFSVGYTFKMSEYWRFGAKINPRIASTLTKSISADDLFLNGGVYFIKDRTEATDIKRPYRIILGLTYNTTVGLPIPLPFVSYFRNINDRWSFTLGVPKMNLKRSVTENQNIQAFIALDGYYAHIQEPSTLNGRPVDHISLSVAVGGLGYEYQFTKHLVAYSYFGYTFRLNNVFRNKDREEIFKLDDVNAFYLRTGLKFKI